MKNPVLLIIFIAFICVVYCAGFVLAATTSVIHTPSFMTSAVCDYAYFCHNNPYDLSSKIGQTISTRIGATFLSEKMAQVMVKNALKKMTDQKFDVSVKSYSFLDLIHGRFKSIVISGKNLNFNGVYLSSLTLKTVCDFNYVQLDRNPIKFKENMIMRFFTVITDADLTKTMNSNGYFNSLNCVNVEGCGITFFKLSGAGVEIKDNKLYFNVRVTSQLLLAKPLDISIATDLKAVGGRIVFTKVDLGNMVKGVDLSNLAYHLSDMNPLTFSLNVLENPNTKMCINNVQIVDDKILVSGNIFIPQNVVISK